MMQKIGKYYLTQDINSAYGLEEYSEQEYLTAEQVGMKRTFENEKIFNGENAEFASILWDYTTIGSTNGKIYKIALQIFNDDKRTQDHSFNLVVQFVNNQIGPSSEHSTEKYIWETLDSNIQLTKGNKINMHYINFIFTASFIKNQASVELIDQLKDNYKKAAANLKIHSSHNILYKQSNFTDDENLRWCWLRSVEWGVWPLFVTQPIVPFLLLYFHIGAILFILIALTWLWALIRYRFVSVTLASLGVYFVLLKWAASIGIGIYFLTKAQYFLAVVCGCYPLLVLVLNFIVPPTKIGVLQNIFMNKLGYYKS